MIAVVEKKEKPTWEANSVDIATATKRKAEDDVPPDLSKKKAKLESEEEMS